MKKKVLMTASVYTHIRNFHLPYLREFQRLGWETHLACRGIPQNAPFVDKAIELPFEKKLNASANFRAARQLRREIMSERYDLIITHTTLASFFTRLAVKGMKKRPRLVNVMHGYLFDENTPFFKRQLLLNAERMTAAETDLLLVMNEWDYQTAHKYRLGKRIEKVPGMGVDFSRLDSAPGEDKKTLRKALGIPEDDFVMIYPAEFSKRKSQHVLIEAMQYLPEKAWLVLCGEGDQLSECKGLAEKLGLQSRILFPGQVGNIADWYRMADALAASSRSEGLPFNVMEAMHMRLPVIASAVKGHTDLVCDKGTGLLYPYGSGKECAARAAQMMLDAEMRKTMGGYACEAVKIFALSSVMPVLMEEYLLEKNNCEAEQTV